MSVALRGTAQYATTGTAAALTVSVNAPSGLAANDVIFIYCCNTSASTATWSCPGFTALTQVNGTNFGQQILWRKADGTEGASFTVTISTSADFVAGLMAFSGSTGSLDPSSTSSSGQRNAASTTASCSSITVTNTNDMLIWFCGARVGTNGGTPPTITVPTSFAAQGTQINTSDARNRNVGCLGATLPISASGATGAQNGSLSASNINGTFMVGLAPAAVAAFYPFAGPRNVAVGRAATW